MKKATLLLVYQHRWRTRKPATTLRKERHNCEVLLIKDRFFRMVLPHPFQVDTHEWFCFPLPPWLDSHNNPAGQTKRTRAWFLVTRKGGNTTTGLRVRERGSLSHPVTSAEHVRTHLTWKRLRLPQTANRLHLPPSWAPPTPPHSQCRPTHLAFPADGEEDKRATLPQKPQQIALCWAREPAGERPRWAQLGGSGLREAARGTRAPWGSPRSPRVAWPPQLPNPLLFVV